MYLHYRMVDSGTYICTLESVHGREVIYMVALILSVLK